MSLVDSCVSYLQEVLALGNPSISQISFSAMIRPEVLHSVESYLEKCVDFERYE